MPNCTMCSDGSGGTRAASGVRKVGIASAEPSPDLLVHDPPDRGPP